MTQVRYEASLDLNDEVVFPMDRWGFPQYVVQVGTGSVAIEGTLNYVNRGETAVYSAPQLIGSGDDATAVATGDMATVVGPLEAIKIIGGANGTTVTVMQTGAM